MTYLMRMMKNKFGGLPVRGQSILYKKKYKKLKKRLALQNKFVYTDNCCDMIAMKREVAADKAGFPWSECQVRKLTTSHCTSSENHHRDGRV